MLCGHLLLRPYRGALSAWLRCLSVAMATSILLLSLDDIHEYSTCAVSPSLLQPISKRGPVFANPLDYLLDRTENAFALNILWQQSLNSPKQIPESSFFHPISLGVRDYLLFVQDSPQRGARQTYGLLSLLTHPTNGFSLLRCMEERQ